MRSHINYYIDSSRTLQEISITNRILTEGRHKTKHENLKNNIKIRMITDSAMKQNEKKLKYIKIISRKKQNC